MSDGHHFTDAEVTELRRLAGQLHSRLAELGDNVARMRELVNHIAAILNR